ncbi:hypothetical protein V6N12_037513 [Hibiscus sabdariffa]|uniref:Uncharacterized protein n=1 Tax=Hibiscus sabdariffa TaxID=183260 RepID=A0ABR2AIZ6_9ROSI
MLSFSNQLDAAGETVRGMAHDTPQTVNMGSNKTSLTQPEVQVTNIVADGMVEDTNAGKSGIERNLLVIVHFILYMMTGLLFWNCQGATSIPFRSIFHSLVREHHPRVLSLFEPRVSGSRANKVVAYLGFSHSFRIEAHGFGGGI